MTIEFIGSLSADCLRDSPSAPRAPRFVQDPDYPARVGALHEESGFDRMLVGDSPGSPDGLVIANQVLTATSRLGVLLVQRPGLVAPTVAARQFATLEAFHPGRVAMHLVAGGSDADQHQDGDRQARYRRSEEFLEIVRRTWSSGAPFDYAGDFYRVAGAISQVRPASGTLPVYLSGSAGGPVRAGVRHADVYSLGAEPVAEVAEGIARARAATPPGGRPPRFSVSVRPIAAPTEQEARNRAYRILEAARAGQGLAVTIERPGPDGSLRPPGMTGYADARGRRRIPPASRLRAAGGTTALVGSYEQVAEALLEYIAAGVSALLMCGYDPAADATGCAAIIGLVRARAVGSNCLVA